VSYLRGVFGSGGSRAFGSWSKYFAGISDSRGLGESSCENGGKSGRTIITIIFRLSFRYFFSRSIARSFLVILA
jgi:hypothetical protein